MPNAGMRGRGGFLARTASGRAAALVAVLMLAAGMAQAATPVVSDVTATQRIGTKLVDVSYNVADAGNHALTIALDLFAGNVKLPAVTLSGAVGAGIMPGNGKTITWNAGIDWPGQYAANITAYVTADDGIGVAATGDYLVIDLSAGSNAVSYPVRYTSVPPNINDDACRTTNMWFRLIPAGTFTMGSPSTELGRPLTSNEYLHQVTLTQPFYIGVFQVTQKQYEMVMGTNPARYKGDTRPVSGVSYDMLRGTNLGALWPTHNHVDAETFFGKLRTKTSLVADLPTEAQWEYACRAGTTAALNNGKDLTGSVTCPNVAEVGRYYKNRDDGKGGYSSEYTKVGMYRPNAWGLYDMHGNVLEWCLDWYTSNLGTSPVVDPKGASSSSRVLRGGSYMSYIGLGGLELSYAASCRSAFRDSGSSSLGSGSSGNDTHIGVRACIQPSP